MQTAFRVSSPYLCQDTDRVVALLRAWRDDLVAPPGDVDLEDTLRKEAYLRLRGWMEDAPPTTPWHEKGLALAMALQHATQETHLRLATARSRDALWEGLAHAILETPFGDAFDALESTARALMAPKAPLPAWFTATLPSAKPARGSAPPRLESLPSSPPPLPVPFSRPPPILGTSRNHLVMYIVIGCRSSAPYPNYATRGYFAPLGDTITDI